VNCINLKSKNTGQSLIEILVAVSIIAVVLVGVSDLISRSLSLATFQTKKNAATNTAQDQLNYFRQIKDQEPTVFFDNLTNYETCNPVYDEENYTCEIFYTNETINAEGKISGVDMTVSITWSDGDKRIDTRLSQTLARPKK